LRSRTFAQCGEAVVFVSNVQQWVRQSKEAGTGGAAFHDKLWSGWTYTAVMPYSIHWVDKLLYGDHHITAE
jgi:hypothetical protein